MGIADWRKKETLIKEGEHFCVEIVHWTTLDDNMWNVYAYVYPDHPQFNNIADDHSHLHFHRGVTYKKMHYNYYNNKVTSIQLGSDYNHLFDDYKNYSTFEDVADIIQDAEKLYNQLSVPVEDVSTDGDIG